MAVDVLRFVMWASFQRPNFWKPAQSMDCFPPGLKTCDACLRVVRKTAGLPCSHVFCEFCLKSCRAEGKDGQHSCIIDGTRFGPEEEVLWKECSQDDAICAVRLKVTCPNVSQGCEFVGAVLDMPEHIDQHCAFDKAQCQRCNASVLLREIRAHHLECEPTFAGESSSFTVPSCNAGGTTSGGNLKQSHFVSVTAEEFRESSHSNAHDTLAGLESKFNDIVECVRSFVDQTTLDTASFSNKVNSFKKAMTRLWTLSWKLEPNGSVKMPTSGRSVRASAGRQKDAKIGGNIGKRLQKTRGDIEADKSSGMEPDADYVQFAYQTLPWTHPDQNAETFPQEDSGSTALCKRSKKKHGQRKHDCVDNTAENTAEAAFLVVFKTTKPQASATRFFLFNFVMRLQEYITPDTWTTAVEMENKGCRVKLVATLENSALNVYARVEDSWRSFNPWKIMSVEPVRSTQPLYSTANVPRFKPPWTHSRVPHVSLLASGYKHYGFNKLEALCESGMVVENNELALYVTMAREWKVGTQICQN